MGEKVLLDPANLRIAGVLLFLVFYRPALLAAQEKGPADPIVKESAAQEKSPAAEMPQPSSRRIEESLPSIYYLKDERGNLQAVPNFTLKDFEDLYKLKHQLVQGDPRPRYSLQQLLASGAVNAGRQAELTIQFRILVREDQWTRIPLRLDQAILHEPARYQGPGEYLLSFEGEGEGYVAWVRGPAGKSHELTLKLLVPLTTAGQESRLRLTMPRTTASELRLNVPYAKALARVSEGATLQTPHGGNQETELTAVGLSGEFEMSWHPPNAAPERPISLEAFGTIVSRLDGRGVESEATFSVRSYGEAFDRFHVRLPPNVELMPGNPSGYSLTATDTGRGAAGQQRLVEVQLARPTVGPVEIHFSTKHTADMTRDERWRELAGLEIPEAARQWGTISVSAPGDWQVLWGASRGVRQIDPSPEALRQKDLIAVYEYFALPSSLMARLVTRKTRINVDPEYVAFVDSDQVRLEARLRYTVRGAKVSAVSIAMPDWQIDDVSPDNVVAFDGVPTDSGSADLMLPLVTPTSGQFEIRLKAHRVLAADAKSFSFVLPQPQASAPAAAVVAVLPADNVDIVPIAAVTNGLLRQSAAMPMELPQRQQEPLFYRTDAPKAVFAAELRRHKQRITAGVVSQATLEPAGPRVEQRISYSISYEPADYVLLEVPRELAGPGRLELDCESQILTPVELGGDSDDDTKPVRMRVALPKLCIGRCDLTARYTLPPVKEGGEVHVPLVMPLDVELSGNNLSVTPAAEQQLEVVGHDWIALDTGLSESATVRTHMLSASRPTGEVVLKLRGDAGNAAVVVHRAWLLTCLPRTADRQDCFVLNFTTRRKVLEVALPAGALRERAEVQLYRIDRDVSPERQASELPVVPAPSGDRMISVPLSGSTELGHYLLSMRYSVPALMAGRGRMRIDLPHLNDDARVERMYWQLELPPEQHLATTPSDFTGEFVWQWNRFYFGRQPVMGQADLESWVGLPQQANLAATSGMNRYLFSTMSPSASAEIVTAGRSTIVLAASGLALLAGLALIYLRAARHPAVLLVAAVLLASLAMLNPEVALMAAQAAVVGLVLVLLALILRRWLAVSQPPAIAEIPDSATVTLHGPATGEPPVPVAAASISSKATVAPLSSSAVS